MKMIARTFKSLSDETRLRILALLYSGELCVCDLMAILDLPQSTVSRHLAALRHAGLVDDRRHGVWIYYSLVSPSTPLEVDLLTLLEQRLSEQPQAQNDRAALLQRQREKGDSCRPGH